MRNTTHDGKSRQLQHGILPAWSALFTTQIRGRGMVKCLDTPRCMHICYRAAHTATRMSEGTRKYTCKVIWLFGINRVTCHVTWLEHMPGNKLCECRSRGRHRPVTPTRCACWYIRYWKLHVTGHWIFVHHQQAKENNHQYTHTGSLAQSPMDSVHHQGALMDYIAVSG